MPFCLSWRWCSSDPRRGAPGSWTSAKTFTFFFCYVVWFVLLFCCFVLFCVFVVFFFFPMFFLVCLPEPAHAVVRWLQGCGAAHFSNTSQIASRPHSSAPCWPSSSISAISPIPVLIFRSHKLGSPTGLEESWAVAGNWGVWVVLSDPAQTSSQSLETTRQDDYYF